MEIEPEEIIRTITRLTGAQDTTIMNVYYAQFVGETNLPDGTVLSDMTKWMAKLWDMLEPSFDSNLTLGICQVDVVQRVGVYNEDPELSTAKIEVVRPIGFIVPSFVPSAVGDQYANLATGTVSARTNVPRCIARKSLSGWGEAAGTEGLWTNAALNAMINFAAWWMLGPEAVPTSEGLWNAGTVSMRTGAFAEFTGSAETTNVPGSMVSRKIGRGA